LVHKVKLGNNVIISLFLKPEIYMLNKMDIINNYDNKIILADKPLDWTSNDVINKLKRSLNVKKAGHSGTLDPRATGLLIICTGKMTKSIPDLITADKEYEGIFRIGATSPTYDTESEETNFLDTAGVTDSDIQKATEKFRGRIMQTPPVFSAIKMNGKPVYKMARRGEVFELEPREVLINKFDTERISETKVKFITSVSKGTYIRSLANDFGRELTVGAYLLELRRIRIGDFDIGFLTDKFEIAGDIKFRILEP
jgi:tRNA pseudouridine55 synthase